MIDVSAALKYEGYTHKLVGPDGKDEIWKDVLGWEGYYQISSWGRVKSMNRTFLRRNGRRLTIKERILSPGKRSKYGHLSVVLCFHGSDFSHPVHQLVARNFIGSCPSGMEICHNDGNPANNFLYNIRYDTRKNNLKDMIKHGKSNRGEKCPNSKLTTTDVLQIRELLNDNALTQGQIGFLYGVAGCTVSQIKSKRIWKWLV